MRNRGITLKFWNKLLKQRWTNLVFQTCLTNTQTERIRRSIYLLKWVISKRLLIHTEKSIYERKEKLKTLRASLRWNEWRMISLRKVLSSTCSSMIRYRRNLTSWRKKQVKFMKIDWNLKKIRTHCSHMLRNQSKRKRI